MSLNRQTLAHRSPSYWCPTEQKIKDALSVYGSTNSGRVRRDLLPRAQKTEVEGRHLCEGTERQICEELPKTIWCRRTSGQKRPGNETNCDTKDARGSSRRELRYLKALSVISLTTQWIPEKGPNEPRSPDDPSEYRTTCLFANVSGD